MKVLITTDWYKPAINGVVTSVLNLVAGLENDGHEVRILTLSDSFYSKKDGNVYYVGSINADIVYPNVRVGISAGYEFVEELEEWGPDVIHSQCEFSTFVFAKRISQKTGAPIVHTYHTVYEGYTHYFCPGKILSKKVVEAFSRRIASETDAFIVPSKKILNMLKEYRIDVSMQVIPSGINLDKFERYSDSERLSIRKEIRKKLGIDETETILISIGRVAKEKNLDEIINYLSNEKAFKLRLLVVGDGPYMNEIRELIKERGMQDRVILTGMVKPEEIAGYYMAGDIFVSASNSETQGLTYMEAMASGLALVCRQDECLQDVIENGVNGFTYTDENEFYECVQRLIEDSDRRKNMGEKAKRLVDEKYSTGAFARSCEELYEACIRGREEENSIWTA